MLHPAVTLSPTLDADATAVRVDDVAVIVLAERLACRVRDLLVELLLSMLDTCTGLACVVIHPDTTAHALAALVPTQRATEADLDGPTLRLRIA